MQIIWSFDTDTVTLAYIFKQTVFHCINTLLWRHPIVITVDSNLRIHSFIYESTVDSEQRINSFSMGNSTHDDWSLECNF